MIESDRVLGALILGGAADALGWRNEFWKPTSKRKLQVSELEAWSKRIGRVGGYWEKIDAGEYSDDTQLTLAVARCIAPPDIYDAHRFARLELPYWLKYQRGGGRTILRAARNLAQRPGLDWDTNRFKGYETAGANGVAMRVLPLAIIEDPMARETATWRNAVATHGHARAIIGALTMVHALAFLLRCTSFSLQEFWSHMRSTVASLTTNLPDEQLQRWLQSMAQFRFEPDFDAAKHEMLAFLDLVWSQRASDDTKVFEKLECFLPSRKGSGTGTVAAGIFLFVKYYEHPEQGIRRAANLHGSDTDTIGKFTGNLIGALRGREAYESALTSRLQDRTYFDRMSNYLVGHEPPHWNGATGEETPVTVRLKEGDTFHSRLLGYGDVDKVIKPRSVDRGAAELLEVKVVFESGQSCYFGEKYPTQKDLID